ncbi:hypothetical protein IFM89_021081 [Coptis chinensis]|uniref:INO80 complex subunit B-like conserved region domain-containing protein n=1 Tax=Coptis chinensis TaxID=261450 RepID=A0A835LRY6_9MAGN|nr:hypothetical protein IFM89_021081 [Coptis chinensis]
MDIDNTSKPVSGLQGVPWKDFSGGSFSLRKKGSSKDKMPGDGVAGKKTDKSEPVRKSRRVPKRRVLDEQFDDGDNDEEIRYLKKLRSLKVTSDCDFNYADGEDKHQRKVLRDGKKSRSERQSENKDLVEEELISDVLQKDSIHSSAEAKKEMSLTRRQRALQSGKDASTSLIEFPNGLPPAPPRKHKEKLTEVEQQLKKAEAAQRRRVQLAKAAKESEAEAIRKILGQDSNRKKREDKLKKRRDELAQEKAANARTLPPNTIRWVIRPTGTVVTFSEDVGLPSIFSSKPCSYPPPREKCAGPSCTNPYVYRDSKSELPLCSLKCYKAIHESQHLDVRD